MNLGINMNKIKSLLSFIIIISSLVLSNEDIEESQTIEKDGITYNVNSYSKHLTPISTNDIKTDNNSSEKDPFKYKVTPYFGHISPIGENLRSNYNPGFSIGFLFETPNKFHFLKKDWAIGGNLVFSRLNAKSDSNISNYNIATMEANLSTNFGPIILGFGAGLCPISSSYMEWNSSQGENINIRESNTYLSLSFNIGYKLVEQNDYDLILNMNFKEILGAPADNLSSGTSELFGLNLKFSKSIN